MLEVAHFTTVACRPFIYLPRVGSNDDLLHILTHVLHIYVCISRCVCEMVQWMYVQLCSYARVGRLHIGMHRLLASSSPRLVQTSLRAGSGRYMTGRLQLTKRSPNWLNWLEGHEENWPHNRLHTTVTPRKQSSPNSSCFGSGAIQASC